LFRHAEAVPGPAYNVLTERLVLRCWNPDDAPDLLAVIDASEVHLMPWMPWVADRPRTVDDQATVLRRFRAAFDSDDDYVYGIFDRDTGEVVGGTGLHPRAGPGAAEIGYWIRQDRTGAGLATEAAAALTRVGIEVHNLHRVEIRCGPDNQASAAVARKLGFTHEATLRRRLPFGDDLRDTMIWTLVPDELPASPAARMHVEPFDALGRRLL
jgi:RimJ/RimL family protein N-acetyltransferase